MTIDWARELFEFYSEAFWRLVARLRYVAFEEAAIEDVGLKATFVYAYPSDEPSLADFEATCQTVERHGGRLSFVQLTCDSEELLRRVETPRRVEMKKLASADTMHRQMETLDYFQPLLGRAGLKIDNTDVLPDEVARRIAAHYGLTPP